MREFGQATPNLKELEVMIWRDYVDQKKAEFSTDKSVLGHLSSPIDIVNKYVFGYYLVGFSSRLPAKCSMVARDLNSINDVVIHGLDCRGR